MGHGVHPLNTLCGGKMVSFPHIRDVPNMWWSGEGRYAPPRIPPVVYTTTGGLVLLLAGTTVLMITYILSYILQSRMTVVVDVACYDAGIPSAHHPGCSTQEDMLVVLWYVLMQEIAVLWYAPTVAVPATTEGYYPLHLQSTWRVHPRCTSHVAMQYMVWYHGTYMYREHAIT